MKPRLADFVRLRAAGPRTLAVFPDGALSLDELGAQVIARFDGTRTAADIAAELRLEYQAPAGVIEADVAALVRRCLDRGLLAEGLGSPRLGPPVPQSGAESGPDTLIAELTYRCPFRCAYCSNPTTYAEHEADLSLESWQRILAEAAALGVVQVHFTGGEPLLHPQLEALVAHARSVGLYVQLITSGVPWQPQRLVRLAAAGLDAVQLSWQGIDVAAAHAIAGLGALETKRRVAREVRSLALPLTLNVVLHRQNIESIPHFVELALELGARRLELANAQYLGVALGNRAGLLPTTEQLARARAQAEAAKAAYRGQLEVLFVLPDYEAGRPRACMDGWGARYVVITPDGLALPCHAARQLPLEWPTVREATLAAAWSSPAFGAYRGESWMEEPCRSCDRRHDDHGGCRCQAFALTGNAAAPDPACRLAPHHAHVTAARDAATSELISLRLRRPASRDRLGGLG